MKGITRLFGNRTVTGILVVYCLFAVALLGATVSDIKKFPEEFPAPDFTLKDIFGSDDLTLSAHSGRPVIIYFFASW